MRKRLILTCIGAGLFLFALWLVEWTGKSRLDGPQLGQRTSGYIPESTAGPTASSRFGESSEPHSPQVSRGRLLAHTWGLVGRYRNAFWFRSLQNGPPLTDHPPFWTMIDELKQSLGEEAVPVITQLINSAEATTNKRMLISILAALKTPDSEAALLAFGTDVHADELVRGMALYGLGLLRSEKGWATIDSTWQSLDTNSPLRRYLYAALGEYGNRTFSILAQEARLQATSGQQGLAFQAVAFLRNVDPTQLRKLATEESNVQVRLGAVYALVGNPSAQGAIQLLEIARTGTDKETRDSALRGLCQMIAKGEFRPSSDQEFPQLVLGSQFSQLPIELKLALYSDRDLRASLPITLKDFAVREELLKNPGLRSIAIRTLASDPEGQAVLAQYIHEIKEQGVAIQTFTALERIGSNVDASLSAAALAMASNSELPGGMRDFAWRIMSMASEEEKAKAVRSVGDVYKTLQTERERMDYISGVQYIGAAANQPLLDLLGKEVGPLARLELASTLLSVPGNSQSAAFKVNLDQRLGNELRSLFTGDTTTAAQYVLLHPRGIKGGLESFGQLLRHVFLVFGTERDITHIRRYADLIVFPEQISKNDPSTVEAVREYIRGISAESIDEIRSAELSR